MEKIVFALTMLVTLLTFGCSKADYKSERQVSAYTTTSSMKRSASADMSYKEAAVMHDEIRAKENGGSEAANLTNDERKLIKSAYVRIRVDNLDAADVSIAEKLSKFNAYAASTNAEENSRHYSLRVPAPQFEIFLTEMNGMGRVLQRSENTEDVTLRYYDLEGRLEMKKTLLRTFQTYLTRARTIEEILAVESRIAELQYDIEGTDTQLRHLANRVDYAAIDLNLVGPVSAQTQNETLGEQIKKLFGGFGSFLSTIVIILIGIVIFGIPLVILLTLLIWLFFGKIGLLRKLWGVVRGKKE